MSSTGTMLRHHAPHSELVAFPGVIHNISVAPGRLHAVHQKNEPLTSENQRYKFQVLTLTEQLNLALARHYAARSGKLSLDQISLFDEAEFDREPEPDAVIDVVSHHWK